MFQQTCSTKQKHTPGNADSISSDAGRRLRQNPPFPVEQAPQGPALVSRRNFEDTGFVSTPDDTHLSSPAVRILAGTPSGRSPVPTSPHLPNTQNGVLSSISAPSTFVAANRVPLSCSLAAGRHSSTIIPKASSFSETSVLSVAPNTLNDQEHSGTPPSSNSQWHRRYEDAMSTESSHSPTLPVDQAMLVDTGRLSQVNTSRVLALSPVLSSESCCATDPNADQQNVSTSDRMPGPSEVTLLQQYDLLSLLLRYLFPLDDRKVDESTLLCSLEQIWASREHDFELALEPQFDACHKALCIWIEQRRKTSELRSMIDRQPSAQTLEVVGRVLALNDVRILSLRWEALRVSAETRTTSPEDLLCSTFAVMTRTQGTEPLFKEGLNNLRETLHEFWGSGDPVISI